MLSHSFGQTLCPLICLVLVHLVTQLCFDESYWRSPTELLEIFQAPSTTNSSVVRDVVPGADAEKTWLLT